MSKAPSIEEKTNVMPEKSGIHNIDSRLRGNDIEKEFGGQKGPEPTRYGDWEKGGRVSDF